KDGTKAWVIQLQGLDYGSKTQDEKIALLNNRHVFLDAMAREDLDFTVITQRCLLPLEEDYSESAFQNEVLQEISVRWNQGFERVYRNQHFLVLTQKPFKKRWWHKYHQPSAPIKQGEDMFEMVLDYLSPYNPKVLKESKKGESEKGEREEGALLSFWSRMINGFDHPIRGNKSGKTHHLSEKMTSSTVHFHTSNGLIEHSDADKKLYSRVISVKQWHDSIGEDIFADLFSLPCEFRLVHWLKGKNKVSSSKNLRYAQQQAKILLFSQHVKDQYEQAIEWVDSGQSSLFDVQIALILTCETLEQLEARVQDVRRIFRGQNLKPALETHAAEWLWLSQFPTFNHRVRVNHLFSQNVANLLSFSKDQHGLDRCDWGDGPLRHFKTASGSAYSLQLHVSERSEELAHSLVVAPSGSGKTTFFQHLIGGALRHGHLKAYIFDRLRGTKVFTESVGGQFIDLGEEEGLSLNPLQCEDNPSNRAFLARFLLQLAGTEDDDSILAVNRAVQTIFELPKEDRVLSSIYDSAIDVGSPLKALLKKWVGETTNARWFNGKNDSLDISCNSLVSFEMASLQQDSTAYAAMITYVMHRIREQMQGKALPHLIFIDETAPMLEDELFRSYVKELFREHRKLRGSINVCFQDAGAIINSGIKETILNQCQTVFLFPNPNADKASYFELFNLTEDQWAFIKGTSKNTPKRSVLVKRIAPDNNEAVILDIDLSSLGDHLKFYRSGSESVQLMKRLQKQYGREGWRQPYLEA
ncbi:MAG: hypothetical protein EBT45_07205, partial [Alphaproteobacteria bacterium]|nr:hypothetical protein [Alphaproteobacteria bacterium]